MSLKALIFDVDGTLAETEEMHREAFNHAFAEAGLGWCWSVETYRELLATTGGKERIAAFQAGQRQASLETPLSDGAIAALHGRKTTLYGELVATGLPTARPGVSELIEAARARGLRLALATTTSRPNVDALCLAIWGRPAEALFEVIAAGDEVAAKKPAPDVYDLALRRLGVGPDEALAFEDSAAGLRSAVAAGLRVVLTPSFYTAGDEFGEAHARLDDLADPRALHLLDTP